ncbi:MAG: VUT family protein [Bacillota bacterium]|nr:VUT family protein [Bacillota bacterium]
MRILLYLVSIVSANVITAALAPVKFGIFIIPMGTFLVGATFILRDLVQNKVGKKKTYLFIGIALLLSALVSFYLGDTLLITFASAISFIASESTDTEIYSRLKLPMSWRVFYSGLVGGFLDSVLFVIIGLSPLGANFLPWEAVPAAIAGQIIFKTVVQGMGGFILHLFESRSNQTMVSNQ